MQLLRNKRMLIIAGALIAVVMISLVLFLNSNGSSNSGNGEAAPVTQPAESTTPAVTEEPKATPTEEPKVKPTEEPREPSVQTDIPSLAETYKDYFPIGAAVEPNQLSTLRAELLKKHVNMLVAENVMKPISIQPAEGKFQWNQADAIVEFAKANGMEVRFHTLVWHNQSPAWFFLDGEGKSMVEETDPVKREANKKLALQRLEDHVRTVVERYKNDVKYWDVVNEVIEPADPDGLRASDWYKVTGTDFIETAFRAARKAGGSAVKLYINDYGTDDPVKRDRLYKLVKEMLDRGVPIDGVGHQTHISIIGPTIHNIMLSMEKFHELGLDNQVTELDMSLYNWSDRTDKGYPLPEEVLLKQAERYRELFAAFKEKKEMLSAVVFWGIADDHTWLSSFPVKRTEAPFLFDKYFQAKPSFWSVIDPTKQP